MISFTKVKRNFNITFMFLIAITILLLHNIFNQQQDKEKYGLDFKLTYKTGKSIRKRLTRSDSESAIEGSDCNFPVKLANISKFSAIDFGIIMMETSGQSIISFLMKD